MSCISKCLLEKLDHNWFIIQELLNLYHDLQAMLCFFVINIYYKHFQLFFRHHLILQKTH